jgi:hypothetical protein
MISPSRRRVETRVESQLTVPITPAVVANQ